MTGKIKVILGLVLISICALVFNFMFVDSQKNEKLAVERPIQPGQGSEFLSSKQAASYFNILETAVELQVTGSLAENSTKTTLNASILLHRIAPDSDEVNESLRSHIIFSIVNVSGTVKTQKYEVLNLQELRGVYVMISTREDGRKTAPIISYSGKALQGNSKEAIRLLSQNMHPIILKLTDDSSEVNYQRKDLYGDAAWNWVRFSNGYEEDVAIYKAEFEVEADKGKIESWERSVKWDYLTQASKVELSGTESIALFMNQTKILDIETNFKMFGDMVDTVSERVLLSRLHTLNRMDLKASEAPMSSDTSNGKPWRIIETELLETEPSPTYYSELAKSLNQNDISEEKFFSLLQKLRLNSQSYKALVLAAAFANSKYKKFIIRHIKESNDDQKMALLPLLAQGTESDPEVFNYLKNIDSKSKNRNVRSVSALTMGTLNNVTNAGQMSGGASSEEIFSYIGEKLKSAGDGEEQSIWLSALGNTGDGRALSMVTASTKHNNSYVREKAYFALRNIEDPKAAYNALKICLEGLRDPVSDVRKRAAMASKNIIRKQELTVAQSSNLYEAYVALEVSEKSDKVKRLLDDLISSVDKN